MKYLIALIAITAITGCSQLNQLVMGSAEALADAKEAYCAETDPNVRAQLREAYNAEMDARGLPHDQINCPE